MVTTCTSFCTSPSVRMVMISLRSRPVVVRVCTSSTPVTVVVVVCRSFVTSTVALTTCTSLDTVDTVDTTCTSGSTHRTASSVLRPAKSGDVSHSTVKYSSDVPPSYSGTSQVMSMESCAAGAAATLRGTVGFWLTVVLYAGDDACHGP